MIAKRAATIPAVAAMLTLTACPWGTSPPSPTRLKEHFLVAFVREGMNDVAVTWSETGQSWNNGRFPATPTSTAPPARASVPFNGVGASADTTGVIYNVLFDQPAGYADVAGLGPATWDAIGAKYSLGTTTVLSAPATVDLGGRNRLVAVRQAGGQLGVYLVPAVGSAITTVSVSGVPSSILGRPALVRRNDGAVLLAWRDQASGTIGTTTGTRGASASFSFGTANQSSLVSEGSPAVAADAQYFYLSIVQRSGNSWRTQIYRSPDGAQWTAFMTSAASPNPSTLLGLAALSNGSLLEASITNNQRYKTAAVFLCSRTSPTQSCGRWSQINDRDVFKAGAAFKEFAVIRTGVQ